MKEQITNIVDEKQESDIRFIKETTLELLHSNKEKTYKELIKEINQCRYNHDDEILNDLISEITNHALSKSIQ